MSTLATTTGLFGFLGGLAMIGAGVDPFGPLLTLAALGLLAAAAWDGRHP